MEAGAELDALVEIGIFGGTCARCDKSPAKHLEYDAVFCSQECADKISDYTLDDYHEARPRYSDAAARLVVEIFVNDNYDTRLDWVADHGWAFHIFTDARCYQKFACVTAPLAICKTALKTIPPPEE